MSRLPTALEDAWNNALPKLEHIRAALSARNTTEHPRLIRVGQLDSELLDQELSNLLQEPINKALALINSSFKSRFEPELHLLIQLTLYKLSIWNTGASYGAKLQDLRYIVPPTPSKRLAPSGLPRKILLLHATFTLILPYCHSRIRSHALSHAWPDAPSSDRRRKAWDMLNSVESLHAMLGLANFLAFLWGGRYRTLADRLLRMSLTPSRRLVRRDVSYEFMNRQMVWHAFTEFLLFLLPLITARAVRRRIYRIVSILSPTSLFSMVPFQDILKSQSTERNSDKSPGKRGKYWALSDDQCAICAENATFSLNVSEASNAFTTLAGSASTMPPSEGSSNGGEIPAYPIYNPYQTSCGHIYCYHCVAERMMRSAEDADDDLGWECLRCGDEVKEAHRFLVEVSGSEVSESEYEFSSDLDLGTDLSGSMGSYSESGFSE